MSSVRGRRGGSPAEGRRATGRVPRVHQSRPVRTGSLRTGAVRTGNLRTGDVRTGSGRTASSRTGAPNRPGQRRPGRRPDRRSAAARRRPLFTGRAVLLGALVLLLALTLAGPLRQFLAGRAELTQLAAEGQALDQRISDLAAQLEQQADPAFTEREARERLSYVLPGDRLVLVVDGRTVEVREQAVEDPGPVPPRTWYEGLMDSLDVADRAP
jgi:cell division protein FtsB